MTGSYIQSYYIREGYFCLSKSQNHFHHLAICFCFLCARRLSFLPLFPDIKRGLFSPDSFHGILIPSFILNETNARKPCFLAKICTCSPFFCIIKAFVTLPSHLRARKEPPCRKSLRTKKKKAIVPFCWIRALASL